MRSVARGGTWSLFVMPWSGHCGVRAGYLGVAMSDSRDSCGGFGTGDLSLLVVVQGCCIDVAREVWRG
jgi:hypothetical protein